MSVVEAPTVVDRLADRALASSSDRAAWLEARRGGITATEVKNLIEGGQRARFDLVEAKRSGKHVDLSGNRYVQRGNEREPVIADWIVRKFGIEPNDVLFHAEEQRGHLATPDGVGIVDGMFVMAEIKTSKHDLTPGPVDELGVLVMVDGSDGVWRCPKPGPKFWGTGYYDQVQWQLHVAGAERCLFVWEQHDDDWPNPAPLDLEPRYVWILRDENRIGRLVEVADLALQALASVEDEAPTFDAEVDELAQRVLKAREAEASAKRAREAAWAELTAVVRDRGEVTQRSSVAQVTFTPDRSDVVDVPDVEAAKSADPALFAEVGALSKRWNEHAAKYTRQETKAVAGKLTVTKAKAVKE